MKFKIKKKITKDCIKCKHCDWKYSNGYCYEYDAYIENGLEDEEFCKNFKSEEED